MTSMLSAHHPEKKNQESTPDDTISIPVSVLEEPKLEVKPRENRSSAKDWLSVEEPDRKARKKAEKKERAELKRKKALKKSKPSSAVLTGILGFVGTAAIFGFILADWELEWGIVPGDYYQMATIIGVVSVYALIVLSAFQHGMIHGLICLLFPPYIVIYGLLVSDYSGLKGASLALVAFLAAEWHFVREDSFVIWAVNGVESAVDGGRNAIDSVNADLDEREVR